MRTASLSFLFLSPSIRTVVSLPCTLCQDGAAPKLPDKLVRILGYPEIDCSTLEELVPSLFHTEEECSVAHQVSSLCGCTMSDDACTMCPDGSPVGNPGKRAPKYEAIVGLSPITCDLAASHLQTFSQDDDLCSYSHQVIAESCGCKLNLLDQNNATTIDPGSPPIVLPATSVNADEITTRYFGATTIEDRKRQQNIYRASAVLSIIGALLVISDNLLNRRNRLKKNLFNQIVTAMALFDIIHGISAAFGVMAKPHDVLLGGIGARGNEATCKAQGWFFLWGGMTSLFFNASLSTYYVLVIVYSCRESRLKILRKWMIGIPILIGSIFAFASIPYIVPAFNGCSLATPTSIISEEILELWGFYSTWGPFLGLFMVPGFLVLAYSTVALFRVYFYVRKINKKTNRWRLREPVRRRRTASFSLSEPGAAEHASSFTFRGATLPGQTRRRLSRASRSRFIHTLQNEVFWQSALYLFALYISWLVYLIVLIMLDDVIVSHYALWSFVHAVVPLQGALNAAVYFRPRLVKRWRKILRDLKQRAKDRRQSSSGISPMSNNDDSTNSRQERWSTTNMIGPAAADLAEVNSCDMSSSRRMSDPEAALVDFNDSIVVISGDSVVAPENSKTDGIATLTFEPEDMEAIHEDVESIASPGTESTNDNSGSTFLEMNSSPIISAVPKPPR